MIEEPKPRMTEEEYRSHPGVNKSTLWLMKKSPAHYKYALEHPSPDTPALKLGRAIHMAILEPDVYSSHYVVVPPMDRRTKAGREMYEQFVSQHTTNELIDLDDANDITGMYESVWKDPVAAKLLQDCEMETPLFWTDDATGIDCKCRLDAYKDGLVIDLKSCADASTSSFLRDALRYGYDVQAAHYLRGYKTQFGKNAEFVFIAVEKKPPYAVNVIHASDDFIDRGTWQLISLMDRLKECRDKDEWPAYGENELDVPAWAAIPDEDE